MVSVFCIHYFVLSTFVFATIRWRRSPVWVKPADHIHRQLEECFYSKYCCNKWLFSQKTAKHVHQTAHFILNLKIFSLRSHGTKKGKRNRHNWEAGTIKRSRFVPKKLPELKNQTENHQVGRNCVDLLAECANTLALTTSWGVFSACCWVLTSENQWVRLWFVLSLSAFEQKWIFQLRSAHWSLWPWLWETPSHDFLFHVEVFGRRPRTLIARRDLALNPSRSHENHQSPVFMYASTTYIVYLYWVVCTYLYI